MEFRRVSVEWCLIIGAGSILTRETSRYGLGKGVAPLEMPKLWELWGAFRFPLSSLNPASHSCLQHLALTSPLHRMACCGTRSTSILPVI
jgi:hypothetical protein